MLKWNFLCHPWIDASVYIVTLPSKLVVPFGDYNKIFVRAAITFSYNIFIRNKCSKLTSKFYKSQVGRECCLASNTERYVITIFIFLLYVHLLISSSAFNSYSSIRTLVSSGIINFASLQLLDVNLLHKLEK